MKRSACLTLLVLLTSGTAGGGWSQEPAAALCRADANDDARQDPAAKAPAVPQPPAQPDVPAARTEWQGPVTCPVLLAAVSAILGFLIRQFAPALSPLWQLLASRFQTATPAPDNKVLTDLLTRLAQRLDALETGATAQGLR